jgi:type IV pilus assembly protein PilC
MATFTYTAMDGKGKEVKGTVEAANQSAALSTIREKGLFPTNLQEAGKPGKSGKAGAAAGRKKAGSGGGGAMSMELKMPRFLEGRVKPKQLMVFTRQLATLIDAGLPLLRSLRVIQRQERNAKLKRAVVDMADTIQSGGTFADALAAHGRIFDRLYVNMARAGEIGGVLDVVLLRLAEFMEKMQKIKNKVVSAMVYPIVVLIMAGVIVFFLFTQIIPKFEAIFAELLEGAQLPPLTRLVMNISETLQTRTPLVVGAIVGLIVLSKLVGRFPAGRHALDAIKFKMPVFGPLIQKTAIARFTRTLGTLLNSGVPVLQALTIVRDTSGNEVVARAIMSVHDAVKEGENIAPPIEASGVFPPMVTSMVEVGEETGELPEMLMKIADTFDDEVDNTVAAMSSIIEPILIVMLAVVVGTIVIALFLPLISIIGKLS